MTKKTTTRNAQEKRRQTPVKERVLAAAACCGLSLMVVGAAWAHSATPAEESASESSLHVRAAAQGTDLAALWASNGTDKELTLSAGTYYLSRDVNATANMVVTGTASVDLNGCTLSIAPGASATSAVSFTGTGSFTVKDSGEQGSLDIALGRPVETATSSSAGYRGISVSGGGSLVLQDCAVNVCYTGASTTQPAFTLSGVYLEKGSASLEGGAALTVESAPEEGDYGASTVAGIMAGASAGAVSVGSQALVDVNNCSKQLATGSVDYPEFIGGTGAQSSSNANLLEFKPEPGSELDEMIKEAFLKNAAYDGSEDQAGFVYGSCIYYATGMKVANGMIVWAYSDPVLGDDVGKLDKIVPSHVFIRSSIATPLNAYAVATAAAYSGAITAQGGLSVSTGSGSAYGVYRSSGSSCAMDAAQISTSCGESAYPVSAGEFDLNQIIEGVSSSQSPLQYPKNSKFALIKMAKASAQDSMTVGAETASYEDPAAVDPFSLYPAEGSSVSVEFRGIEGSRTVTCTAGYGQTLAEAGVAAVDAPDYVSQGITYRFVGWKLSGDTIAAYAYEPESLFNERAVDANMVGATKGAVVFNALYVPVASGQHLVTFRVEDYVVACAVASGKTPKFTDANTSISTADPAKITSVSGYTFDFAGWYTGDSSECIAADGESLCSGTQLPAATQDAVYTARFAQAVTTQKLNLYYWRQGENSLAYSMQSVSDFDWTGSAIDVANQYVKVGDTFVYEGEEYTFIGWSARMSDQEPMYPDELPQTTTTSNNGAVNYFGVYQVKGKNYTVEFYVGDELYAVAEDVASRSTVYSAIQASTNPANPTTDAEGVSFRGWNTSAKASTYLLTSVVTVGSLPQEGGTVRLYAIWKDINYPLVTFYDSDKSTVVDILEVSKGSTVTSSTGENPAPTGENRDRFEGWVTADGTPFSCELTIVEEDMAVFATYTQLNTGTGTLEDGSEGSTGGGLSSNTSTGSVGSGGALKATTIMLDAGSKKGSLSVAAGKLGKASKKAKKKAKKDGDEDDGNAEALAAAAGTGGNGSAGFADGDTGAAGGGSGVVGFLAVCAMFLLLVAAAASWFIRRRREDLAEEQLVSTPGIEPLISQMRF